MIQAIPLDPMLGQRDQARFVNAPEFAGMSGVLDDASIASLSPGAGVALAGGALVQGALGGALIGGLAAGSMRGAGTGALLAGGLGAAFAGAGLLLVSGQNQGLRVGGAVGLVAGIAGLVLGGVRAKRAIKRK